MTLIADVDLTLAKGAVIMLAGGAAGFINSIVGSGTLISFPTLVGLGFAGPAANMSNGAGLFPGGLSAVAAQRPELVGQKRRLSRLAPASFLGGILGAVLLLNSGQKAFETVVPFLILFGVALVIVGPTIQQKVRDRNAGAQAKPGERVSAALWFAIFGAGVYGGYFGAAQGIILMGILGIGVQDSLPRLNATKNVLTAIANGVAGVVFVIRGGLIWPVVGLIAAGSVIGGQIGARVGRKIPPVVLRSLIVIVGLIAAIHFLRRK
jgi:uncharacterized protein